MTAAQTIPSLHKSIGVLQAIAGGLSAATVKAISSTLRISRAIEHAEESCWVRQTPEDVCRRVREVRDKGLCCELGQYHSSIFAVSIPLQLTREDRGALTLVGWPDQFAGPRLQAIEKRLKSAARRFHSILETKEK